MTDLAREADDIAAEFQRVCRRRLIAWCIRWTIGFTLTAWVTANYEGTGWLWYAAIGVASLTLLMLVLMNRSVQAKARSVAESVQRDEELD